MDDLRDSALGRLIADLRRSRGWSQSWLASQAGMTQSVLSRVEAGKREARASELAELARALGVGPETLLEGAEQVTAAAASEAAMVDRAMLEAPERMAAYAPDDVAHADLAPDLPAESEAKVSGNVDARLFSRTSEPGLARQSSRSDVGLERDAQPRVRRAFETPERLAAPSPDRARSVRLDEPSPSLLPSAARAAYRGAPPPQLASFSSPVLPDLPPLVADVIVDYVRLRGLATEEDRPRGASWRSVDSLGRRRPAGKPPGWRAGRPAAAVSWNEPRDRYARLWRHELGIGVDGPVPDLVALFEDAGLAEVVVARLGDDEPVCANVTVPGAADASAAGSRRVDAAREPGRDAVGFIVVNADRPVTLQRHALVHAFAHLVLGHGDVVDRRIEWSRATPPEAEANDFAEEFLAPVDAVARWYDRHDDPHPSVDVLLELAGAFGITFWAALYRSRAAGRLGPKPFARLSSELRGRQWELLPEQSYRGGLRDTLSTLGEEAPLPAPGAEGVGGVTAPRTRDRVAAPPDGGAPRDGSAPSGDRSPREGDGPAVLRVPARLRVWTLQALRGGLISFERAADVLHRSPGSLAAELERLGLE